VIFGPPDRRSLVISLVRLACAAVLCGLVLPDPTAPGSAAVVAVTTLAVVLVAVSTCVRRVGAAVAAVPTGCAAEGTSTPPVARLHQLDPDAAGQPRPRAPGRRTAVAAA
jgi:uncharacterized protein DUF6412